MLKHSLLALLVVVTATAGLAQAPSKKGANGGMLATSQGHPIEFVLKGQELIFYVIDDDGSPLPTKDMQGGRRSRTAARRRPCRCSLLLRT